VIRVRYIKGIYTCWIHHVYVLDTLNAGVCTQSRGILKESATDVPAASVHNLEVNIRVGYMRRYSRCVTTDICTSSMTYVCDTFLRRTYVTPSCDIRM
jgi:hypothetical protein